MKQRSDDVVIVADIRPGMAGPCGPVYSEIIDAVDVLNELLPEVPLGITDDPRAEASEVTLTELAQVRDLLNQASDLIERVNEREAKYSANNGWQLLGNDSGGAA